MEPDDLYQNDSTFFLSSEPAEQSVARKKEKAQTLESLSLLQGIIARFEERIDFYGSVDAMPDELKTQPTEFLNMHNANQLTRDSLRAEKEWLEGLLETHAPNK